MSFSQGLPIPPGEPPPIRERPLTVKLQDGQDRARHLPGLRMTLAILVAIAVVLLLLLVGIYGLGVWPGD